MMASIGFRPAHSLPCGLQPPQLPQFQRLGAAERRQLARPLRRRPSAVLCRAEAAPKVVLYDVYDQEVPYEQARLWQKDMVEQVAARSGSSGGSVSSIKSGSTESCNSVGTDPQPPPLGALLMLQHPPVYTLGAGATEGHLKFDPAAPPLPLYRTERGGEVTYHGPGQLVLYPILDLRRPPLQPDLHWYLRQLEEVVMRALNAVSGLHGERIPGLTGVWVGGQKVAALGVRASRWVTYHGLALNVTTDLAPFGAIVPCGISDRSVASVAGLLAAAAAAAAAGQDSEGTAATTAGAGAGQRGEDTGPARGAEQWADARPAGEEKEEKVEEEAAAASEPLGWEEDPLAAGFGARSSDATTQAVVRLLQEQQQAEQQAEQQAKQQKQAEQQAKQTAEERQQQQQAERMLVLEYRHALLEAFEEVFGVDLVPADPMSDDMAVRLASIAGTAAQAADLAAPALSSGAAVGGSSSSGTGALAA